MVEAKAAAEIKLCSLMLSQGKNLDFIHRKGLAATDAMAAMHLHPTLQDLLMSCYDNPVASVKNPKAFPRVKVETLTIVFKEIQL